MVIAGRKNHQGDLIINQLHHVLGERLIYLGPVSEERKWRILSNAEGLVMPSEYEGFGIPIYEGYAVGTPVLIADNSSMSELAARDEQLFDTFNVDQLRNALIEVAESSDWVQPAVRKGRSIVSSATWQKIAEKTKLVYKQLM
ncbi:MAG: hypothetical protein CME32_00885 [Gimesia sp.]|nr:hypothetical protein [Gimesia sp.]